MEEAKKEKKKKGLEEGQGGTGKRINRRKAVGWCMRRVRGKWKVVMK